MLLESDGELIPKILDFGLARMGTASDLSMTGYGMGTPYYMPPEQRRDAKNVNHTADIYSLGKMFYEMVTAEIPDNVDQQMIPPPKKLSDIIFKCIKSKPEERYFSVDDFLRDLKTISTIKVEKVIKSHIGSGIQCPSCNFNNNKNAKFCKQCGQGLTKICPECTKEEAIDIPFCELCGTNIDKFNEATEVLNKMQRYASEKKWSRIQKEKELLGELTGLNGKIGKKLKEEIKKIYSDAKTSIKKKEHLEKSIQHKWDKKQYFETKDEIEKYIALTDDHEKYFEINEKCELEITGKIIADEYIDIISNIKKSIKEDDFLNAQKIATSFIEKYPESQEKKKVQNFMQRESNNIYKLLQ